MALPCSTVFAYWTPLVNALRADVNSASRDSLEGRKVQTGAIAVKVKSLIAYYEALSNSPTPRELPTITREGLQLALRLEELCKALGLQEGDEFFDLCDELADHAEILALSQDEDVLSSLRQSLDEQSRK